MSKIHITTEDGINAMSLDAMLEKVECGKELLDDMIIELLNSEQNDEQKMS